MENSTYALVASSDRKNGNHGVQIINIDDPYNPTNTSTRYPKLDGARSITTATIGGSTYALVTSSDRKNGNLGGVQIINITDPYNPTNASYVVDSERYPLLEGASSITTTTIGGSTYALVHPLVCPNHKLRLLFVWIILWYSCHTAMQLAR